MNSFNIPKIVGRGSDTEFHVGEILYVRTLW